MAAFDRSYQYEFPESDLYRFTVSVKNGGVGPGSNFYATVGFYSDENRQPQVVFNESVTTDDFTAGVTSYVPAGFVMDIELYYAHSVAVPSDVVVDFTVVYANDGRKLEPVARETERRSSHA